VAERSVAIDVLGIGVLGPGLAGWAPTRAVLRGEAPYANAATAIPPPQRLPATERRRAGTIIKVSIVAADEALAMSGCNALDVATVFSASEGDGRNCHEICEALTSNDRLVSPTRFTNSVHNAPAGYWHIATHSMAASTSLCAYDASFAMGLLEAALQVQQGPGPVLLVAADAPYPEPLHATRPLPDAMAIALVLAPPVSTRAHARLNVAMRAACDADRAHTSRPELDALSHALPVARGLPLLEALARDEASACVIDAFDDLVLQISVEMAR
jgi:hypothetical protein